MNKPKEKWEKRFEKLIIKQLFLAWEAGKKQVKTSYKYTLDTDKLGRPIFDMAMSKFEQKLKEREKEIIKEFLSDIKSLMIVEPVTTLEGQKVVSLDWRRYLEIKEKYERT